MTSSTPWHITHPPTQAVAHVAGFRADMTSRNERCVVTMVAVELYREAFRDLLNSNEHENSNTAVHVGEFFLKKISRIFIFVWEISLTDVVFCLTRTGACPARGVWPRGATELPVGTNDDGATALRSLRAASGRRAVVSFLFICAWAISMTPCFVYKGRTGLNADSSRSHFIVGLCVETGEYILTFVRAVRVSDGVFCV